MHAHAVLVSLYEEPDKPKQGVDYIKACLGGPTPDEYEALLAEREALQRELADARQQLADLEARVSAWRLHTSACSRLASRRSCAECAMYSLLQESSLA